MFMNELGYNLINWRESKGLTQEALSDLCDIPRPNLSAIEQGRRDITYATLLKLAKALQLTPGTLIDHKPDYLSKIGRHERDELARAIATGERPFNAHLNQLADLLASLISNQLQCFNVRGYARVKRLKSKPARKYEVEGRFGRELVKEVLLRLPKYLKEYEEK